MLEYLDQLTQPQWIDGVPYVCYLAVPLCLGIGSWIPSLSRLLLEGLRSARYIVRYLRK